jgi:hypothetical protein
MARCNLHGRHFGVKRCERLGILFGGPANIAKYGNP